MRRWLGAVAVSALLAAPATSQESPAVQESKRLAAVLRANTDVLQVTECYPPGTDLVVYHLMNAHYGSPGIASQVRARGTPQEADMVFKAVQDIHDGVNRTQRRLSSILDTLERIGYRELRTEGISAEQFDDVTPDVVRNEYDGRFGAMRMAGLFKHDPALDAYTGQLAMDAFTRQLYGVGGYVAIGAAPTPPASFATVRYAPGAELVHYLEGKIELLPFEREEVYRRSIESDDNQITYDERESAFLDIVAQARGTVTIAVLGADHALGGAQSCPNIDISNRTPSADMLAAWNRDHEERIGVVEVVPKGLPELLVMHERAYKKTILPIVKRIMQREESRPRPQVPRIVGSGSDVRIE